MGHINQYFVVCEETDSYESQTLPMLAVRQKNTSAFMDYQFHLCFEINITGMTMFLGMSRDNVFTVAIKIAKFQKQLKVVYKTSKN